MALTVTEKIYDLMELVESYTSESLTPEEWPPKFLDKFCKHLKLDRAALFLQNSHSSNLELVSQNLLKHHDSLYLEYYYNLDPFRFVTADGNSKKLQLGPGFHQTVVSFNDVVNRKELCNSEYYQKFMRPQNLAHDLVVYFQSREKLLGVASLMRHHKSGEFAPDEIRFLKIAAPLITLALDNLDLKRLANLQKRVLSLTETAAGAEIVILNMSLEIVYATLSGRNLLASGDGEGSVFDIVCAHCNRLLQFKSSSPALTGPALKSEFKLQDKLYSLSFKLLHFDSYATTKEGFFVVTLNSHQSNLLNYEKIMQRFKLTRRESEIVAAVFQGQRNSEIAACLYISEITVKKHLQNICAKLNVKNRTAIINTILAEFGVL